MSRYSLIVFCLFGCALGAQEPGKAILRRAAETHKSIRSESFEAMVVMQTQSSSMRMEMPMTGAMVRPGKLRLDMKNAMLSSQTISDGRNTWKYVPAFQQFTRKPETLKVFSMSEGPGDIVAGENLLVGLRSAKLLRREKLPVDGQEVECDVVEAEYAAAPNSSGEEAIKTFWVDRDRNVILKLSFATKIGSPGSRPLEVTETITITSIRLDQPIAESLFAFVPPAGAAEVDELMPPANRTPAPAEKK
jgi:outer membrane lipoprotein-sorting protein